jgi:tRNA dimethylallyltransferase
VTAVLAVVGPTGSGKSALAVELAVRLQSEVVSADSMQFYRHMAIGTGAPTPEQRRRVPHHFVEFLDPSEDFCAGAFQLAARERVAAINATGRPAVVAGGSGLYVQAVIDGLFDGPQKQPAVRKRLHQEASQEGKPALYARLEGIDPAYAAVINSGDLIRIVRALEVFEVTGVPLSVLHAEHRRRVQSLDAVQVGLDWPRHVLYERINRRVDTMLDEGLLDEVRWLLEHGYEKDLHRLRSLGYREMAAHLKGECPFEEAVAQMKQNTRRFAKRQLGWFRADKRIHWIPVDEATQIADLVDQALALVQEQG